ncbi:14297_t:CDS:2 [Ambispora leptoticha]|uniref:14297_t:CDS:1 n=1 Tax=Ambispora leptoticha TaxID=144679 RepID=A0A9N9C792_9GLOM|nr:14297_t:CDS:2 [Ambispora leptoticha]
MGNRQSKRRYFKPSAEGISSTSSDEYSSSSTDSSFRYVNGRKFYRDIPNVFPVDEKEAIRNEKKQTIARLVWQGNFSSPIEDLLKTGGLKILDVGCGPGTWIIEMAKTYPLCTFTGVDITPIYPLRKLPKNVDFIEANILDGIPLESGGFDFVVMHFLTGCFTSRQWESTIIQEVVRVMKSGAWFEWMEIGIIQNQGEITKKLSQAFLSAVKSQGMNPWLCVEFPKILDNSGMFINIRRGERQVTYSSAAGKCGELSKEVFFEVLQGLKKQSMEFMSITSHEYDRLLNMVLEEFEQYQTYNMYYRYCGQRIDD